MIHSKIKISPVHGRVVCVIRTGKRYFIGINDDKTSPKWQRKMSNGDVKSSRHAEMHALQLAQRVGGKIKEIVVLRWTKRGKLTMARPCSHCKKRFDEAGINQRIIWHSDWDGNRVRY